MPKLLLIYLVLSMHLRVFSQAVHFSAAYQQHPEIPRGFLEAISYTHTRFSPINPEESLSCSGMPLPFGIMGVFDHGNGYFI